MSNRNKFLDYSKLIIYTQKVKDYIEKKIPKVTRVKGNAESVYRDGDINLTAENIGAIPTYNQTIDLSESIYDQSKWYPVTGTELPITKLSLIRGLKCSLV